jgi:hypothetical protein
MPPRSGVILGGGKKQHAACRAVSVWVLGGTRAKAADDPGRITALTSAGAEGSVSPGGQPSARPRVAGAT